MVSDKKRLLPANLERLEELALDLRLTGSQLLARIWRYLDAETAERINNPYVILQNVAQDRLDALSNETQLMSDLEEWLARREQALRTPGWFREEHRGSKLKSVAYFSMEFGLGEELPIYSGGLGILAGDHLKSASDLDVPLIGVGLLYQQGYFHQVLSEDGWQLQALPFNDPGSLPVLPVVTADGSWPKVEIELPGRKLLLRVWSARVGRVTLYLLDSNHPMNGPWDRGITASLYDAGQDKRMLQEMVLGIGGWRLLERLGMECNVCHLNEGHAAFAIVERAASFSRRHQLPFQVGLRATRAGNVFTTHTPVAAAFDKFAPEMFSKYAQPFADTLGISMNQLLSLGRSNPLDPNEPFNMAMLALRGSCHVNGVSRLHGQVSRELFREQFPGWPVRDVPIKHITNGVHVPTWDSLVANRLWRTAYRGPGRWADNLQASTKDIRGVTDLELWEFRARSRELLIEYVRRRLEHQVRRRRGSEEQIRQSQHVLNPNALTLGFARRFTEYKRPNLVIQDPARLSQMLTSSDCPVQFIVAGKAHPNDEHGKSMVQAMAQFAARPELQDRFVFLEDYDIKLAQHFAMGIDVWVNTPRRPAEACGTSGMKMVVNGGLQLSVLDGWWDEAYRPELGWAIGNQQAHGPDHDCEDARHFYELLERQIVPDFYARDAKAIPLRWVQKIRDSMSMLTEQFSSNRMLKEYVASAYQPAAEAYELRVADAAQMAKCLEQWHKQVQENWRGMRLGELMVERLGENWKFDVQAWLGDMQSESVRVQLYADPIDDHAGHVSDMQMTNAIVGAVNGYSFSGSVPADRPANHYTPRIVPYHPQAFIPHEDQHIFWAS